MRVGLDMNGENEKLDFLTGQQFDQIDVPIPTENNAFMAALKELTPDMMKKLNIDVVKGTMVRIAVVDNDNLWNIYKSKMIMGVEKLESLVKSIIESQQGILVKIIHDSFICFFPDKSKARSSIFKTVYAACKLRTELEEHPIYLEDDNGNSCTLQVVIFLSYGTTYKRSLHIQRKLLHDYYGEIVDNVLNQKCTVTNPEHIFFLMSKGSKSLEFADVKEAKEASKEECPYALHNCVKSDSACTYPGIPGA